MRHERGTSQAPPQAGVASLRSLPAAEHLPQLWGRGAALRTPELRRSGVLYLRGEGVTIILGIDPGDEERFWALVDRSGECWEWRGCINRGGYGSFRSKTVGHPIGAHRMAYLIEFGILSDRLHPIDHLCRNRRCVRPSHLEHVEFRTNVVTRGTGPTAVNALKTHCVHGHEFTPENTYMEAGRYRKCRTCRREKSTHWARKNYSKGALK